MIWLPDSHAAIRDARGYSLREEARKSDIDSSYLARLERDGIRNPSREVVGSLAHALDVPVSAIALHLSPEELVAELVSVFEGSSLDLVGFVVDRLRGRT